ncbi:MAG: hypothetical protein VKN72_12365 [Nostocales cyanobacterium 94392]|nr:hypothetical protein [Nostocales cyanobacterium 94392]
MKNHFASPTKRRASGTSEEFQRARKAHKETGQPDNWVCKIICVIAFA